MTSPSTGFQVHLDELEHGATTVLPRVADILRPPAKVLSIHEGLGGPTATREATGVQETYAAYMDFLAARQNRLCDAVGETAEALRQIVELYRRADGQG